jgi:hypothetical protein
MKNRLEEILQETNTVILPTIGALTVTDQQTKEVLFMPYLNYNDGKLTKFVSEKEGVTEEKAAEMVQQYLQEIKDQLATKNTYPILPNASFRLNESGEIELVLQNNVPISPEKIDVATKNNSIDLQKTDKNTDVTSQIPDKEEEILESDDSTSIPNSTEIEQENLVQPTVASVEIPEQKETPEYKTTQIEETQHTVETPTILPLEEEKSTPTSTSDKIEINEETTAKIYTEEDQWQDDLDVPPLNAKIERPRKPILEKTQSDKKRKRPIALVMVLLVFVLIGGTYTMTIFSSNFQNKVYGLLSIPNKEKTSLETIKEIEKTTQTVELKRKKVTVKKSEKQSLPNKTNIPIDKEVEKESPIVQNSLQTPSSEIIQTSTGQVDKNKPFHLIGGAFSEKNNAEKLQKKWLGLGYSSVIIGKFDQLFVVSIASFENKQFAEAKRLELKNSAPNAWVFQWP